jgi:hypothetical protein
VARKPPTYFRNSQRGEALGADRRIAVSAVADCALESHPQSTGNLAEDVEAPDLALTTLNLAEPVLGPTYEVREDPLGQTAPASVQRDALADAQVIAGAPHVPTIEAC